MYFAVLKTWYSLDLRLCDVSRCIAVFSFVFEELGSICFDFFSNFWSQFCLEQEHCVVEYNPEMNLASCSFENTFTDLFLLDSRSNLMSWHCQNLVHKTKPDQLKTPRPSPYFTAKVKSFPWGSGRRRGSPLAPSVYHHCQLWVGPTVEGGRGTKAPVTTTMRRCGFPLLVFWVELGSEPRDSVNAGYVLYHLQPQLTVLKNLSV